jgi:hypothetical protein
MKVAEVAAGRQQRSEAVVAQGTLEAARSSQRTNTARAAAMEQVEAVEVPSTRQLMALMEQEKRQA